MRERRVADLLAWEQVALELNDKAKSGSVDAQRMQRLTVELEKAKKLVPDAIRQAWCMIVTVSETNDVHAFKLGITDDPLFMTLKSDPRSRMQETKITAESLLPDVRDEHEQSAAYLKGWLDVLREPDHRRWLVQAANQAGHAADFILGRSASEPSPAPEPETASNPQPA